MSKTIDFKKPLLLPSGKESERETVADVALSILAGCPTGTVSDVMKVGGWWKKLAQKEALVLDDADVTKLKDLVAASDRAETFLKIQVLEALSRSSDDDDGGHTPFPPNGPKGKK